jgi:hypothetical protein
VITQHEHILWRSIRQQFPTKAWRIENKVASGLPDVFCLLQNTGIWVELKSLAKSWPLNVPHFTYLQKATGMWLRLHNQPAFALFELRCEQPEIVLVPTHLVPPTTQVAETPDDLRKIATLWVLRKHLTANLMQKSLLEIERDIRC